MTRHTWKNITATVPALHVALSDLKRERERMRMMGFAPTQRFADLEEAIARLELCILFLGKSTSGHTGE
jgi:hypothetical protein